jgi:predicted DNA-binding transcriptional regulator AlpA
MSDHPEISPKLLPGDQLLVDASGAAALCGVARSTWLSWDAAGRCPRRIVLGGRVLWSREQLERWAAAGCPERSICEQEATI